MTESQRTPTAGVRRDVRQPMGDAEPMRTYNAAVQRSGDWWAITVPELPGVFTQAPTFEGCAAVAREAIALVLDVPENTIEVKVTELAAIRLPDGDHVYEFSIVLAPHPSLEDGGAVEALGDAGATDASVHRGPDGVWRAGFAREAADLAAAVQSAIGDIEGAGLRIERIEPADR